MKAKTERLIRDRLQLMKPNVLNKNGSIRLDISSLELSENEKQKLRDEGVLVSCNDLILTIFLLQDAMHLLDPCSIKSELAREFERSVYNDPIYRAFIDMAAAFYYAKREETRFASSERLLKELGFRITKQHTGDFFKFSYLIEALDPDFGSRYVKSCIKDSVLETVENMNDEFAYSIYDHLENADYVIVDSKEFKRINFELRKSKKDICNDSKKIKFKTLLQNYQYVRWSASELTYISEYNGRKLVVVEKDSEDHLRCLNLEMNKCGFQIRKSELSHTYNVYRCGTFHKPVIRDMNTPTHIIIAMEDFVGV